MMSIMRSLRDGLVQFMWRKGNDAEKVGDLAEYNTDSDDDDDDNGDDNGDNCGDMDHDAICGICMDSSIYFDSSTRFKNYPACKHYDNNYCNSCLYKYTSEQIESKKFGLIKCPYPSCKHQFKKKLIKEVVEDNVYSNYMTEKRNIREELKCRANPFYAVKKYALTAWDNLVINLKSFRRRGMINSSSRRCPSCSYVIEKNGGCQHMTCCVCKHEFFWCCGMSYGSNHSNIACLVSKYWFSCVLVAGLAYLLQPLFALLIKFLVNYVFVHIFRIHSAEQLDHWDVIKKIAVFIINVPDTVYYISSLRMVDWYYHHYDFFGITYGGAFYKFLKFFSVYHYPLLGTLVFTSLYFAPTHDISNTGYDLIIVSMGSFISVIYPYLLRVFGMIEAIALHPITIVVYQLIILLPLIFLMASYAKVFVAFNIEKMKKNVSSIVVTPSMEELTTQIPNTSRLLLLEPPTDIKFYWRFKYSINNPLVSVLVTALLLSSVDLLLKPSEDTNMLAIITDFTILWEIMCFSWQFNSLRDCVDGLRSLTVAIYGSRRCDTVQFMLPHTRLEPAVLLIMVATSRFWVDIIGVLLCNPTIVVFLTLTLSIYYYVTKII